MTMSIRFTILVLLWGFSFYPFADAASLGRLFTTHKERAVLDAGRPPKITAPIKLGEKRDQSGLLPPLYITFNGLMTRSQGPAMVWINGSKINGSNKVQQGFIVEIDKMYGITVPIFLSKAQQRCFLKPGQTLNTQDKDEVKLSCINLTRHNQDLP
jgi:hypothetical protein